MSKPDNLRSQTDEELQAQCEDLRKEIFELKNAVASQQKDAKPYQIQQKRKDVARCLTILRERQLQQKSKKPSRAV